MIFGWAGWVAGAAGLVADVRMRPRRGGPRVFGGDRAWLQAAGFWLYLRTSRTTRPRPVRAHRAAARAPIARCSRSACRGRERVHGGACRGHGVAGRAAGDGADRRAPDRDAGGSLCFMVLRRGDGHAVRAWAMRWARAIRRRCAGRGGRLFAPRGAAAVGGAVMFGGVAGGAGTTDAAIAAMAVSSGLCRGVPAARRPAGDVIRRLRGLKDARA